MDSKQLVDVYEKQYPDGYIPQMHSGFFDLGQVVAMILCDDNLGAFFFDDVVSFDVEHHFKKIDSGTVLIVTVDSTHCIDKDDENSDTKTVNRRTTFSEDEYEPIMNEILSRWKQMILDSENTRTEV